MGKGADVEVAVVRRCGMLCASAAVPAAGVENHGMAWVAAIGDKLGLVENCFSGGVWEMSQVCSNFHRAVLRREGIEGDGETEVVCTRPVDLEVVLELKVRDEVVDAWASCELDTKVINNESERNAVSSMGKETRNEGILTIVGFSEVFHEALLR